MKKIILLTFFISWFNSSCYAQENKYVKLSQDLLLTIKNNKDYNDVIYSISCINPDTLANSLSNDNLRKAFWINIYNALAQLTLNNDYKYIDRLDPLLYKKVWIVGQRYLSLNEISKSILGHAIFFHKYDKKYRLDTIDTQIPFALNFGAKDCPPIHIFSSENINDQLYLLANNFIISNCKWVNNNGFKVLYASQLFEWYNPNLGRHYGIDLLMVKYGIMPDGEDYDYVVIKPFNTQVDKRNFAAE